MLIRLPVYNNSTFADGQTWHQPGIAHALTPPETILFNTASLTAIERNPDFRAAAAAGPACVGQCEYRVSATGYPDYLYITSEEAAKLAEALGVNL